MENYRAEVINLSFKNRKVINEYPILDIKKIFWGLVKIYTVSIPENNIEKVVKSFQENMSTALNKEWYITFHTAKKVIVVFRHRIFTLAAEGIVPIYQKCIDTSHAKEKDEWNTMIAYAKSIGIPESQCDFLPENFQELNY